MRRLTVISAVLFCIMGCGNYLDVRPQGYIIPETDEEFAAIIHNIIRDVEGGGDEFIIGNMDRLVRLEGWADNLDANVRPGNNLPSYVGESINTMQLNYSNIWPIIKDCNIIIEHLQGRTSATATGTLSAAYAIKGILYYNMIRDYCEPWEAGMENSLPGLPIVDKFDISAMPLRAPLGETADYAVEMMDKALALNPSDGLYFFTEWVIKAYKAKMLFWMEDWRGTIDVCLDIIGNSGYSLTPYAEYPAMINAENSKLGEVIVRSHINNSSELDWYFSVVKKYLSSRPAAASFVRLFGDEPARDVRWACSVDSRRMNVKTTECKVRLSEIVLTLAEAYCHEGMVAEALECVNMIRRARIYGVTDLTPETLPDVRDGERIVTDAEDKALSPLLQAIMDERRKELFIEGDRWYELKRNGCPEWWVVSNGLKYTTRKYLYTAPIYKRDVDLNPDMIQNPGYED